MNREQIANTVFSLFAAGLTEEQAGVLLLDIEEMIDTAVDTLCDRLIESSEYTRLQAISSVSVQSGIGNLPANVYAMTVLPGRGGRVYTEAGSLGYLPDLRVLLLQNPGETPYYSLRGGSARGGLIYVHFPSGSVFTGNVQVLACARQTLETLDSELQNKLIETLGEMVKNKR